MASVLGKIFQGVRRQDTRESLAKELFTKENIDTKADIPRPLALAIADAWAIYNLPLKERNRCIAEAIPGWPLEAPLSAITDGVLEMLILYRYRVNTVPRNRKARGEFLKAVQPLEYQSDIDRRRAEKLFGLSQE
jgi:hypothetical protein